MRLRAMASRIQALLGMLVLVAVGTAGCGRPAAPPPRSRVGLDLLRTGRIQEAVALLERADEQAPGDATTLANLGLAYAQLEHYDRAERYLKQAAQAAPHDPRLHERLGHFYLKQSRWPAARAAFEEANRRLPVSPRLITARALVEFQAGEFGQALTLLKSALDLDPDYPPALYNLGLLYLENPETLKQAQSVLGRFLTTLGDVDPGEDPDLARRQRTAQAFLDSAAQIRRQPPQAPVPVRETTADPVEPHATPAPAKPDTPVVPQAADQVTPAAEAEPTPTPALTPTPPSQNPAAALVRRAQAAITRESFDEALILLKRATQQHPVDPDALWALAVLYDKHLGYTEEARQTYTQFRERFPSDPRRMTFEPAVRPTPPRPAPPPARPHEHTAPPAPPRPQPPLAQSRKRQAIEWQTRGQERLNNRDWDGAIAAYRQALEHDPGLHSAWYNLGLASRGGGYSPQARTAFEHATRLRPEESRAWYMLGVTCYDLKQTDDAIRHLNQALDRQADYAAAHYLLGLIYSQQERRDDARRHFRHYLRLAPDSAAAEKVRAWMERHVESR